MRCSTAHFFLANDMYKQNYRKLEDGLGEEEYKHSLSAHAQRVVTLDSKIQITCNAEICYVAMTIIIMLWY